MVKIPVEFLTSIVVAETFLCVGLLALIVIQFATSKKDRIVTRQQEKELKERIKDLEAILRKLIFDDKQTVKKVSFLEEQMLQVHNWLGRLTISDFMTDTPSSTMTTTEIMDELTQRVFWAGFEENED